MAESKKGGRARRAFPFRTARGAAALAVVAFVVAGLAFKVGTGTPSAFGIGQIAALCPLGGLEVMLGAKEFMLHSLILLVAVLVLAVLVGKAFCAWACPVPWLQRLLRPGKRRAADAGKPAEEPAAPGDGEAPALAEELAAPADAGASAQFDGGESPAPAPSASCTHRCASCAQAHAHALPPVGGARDGLQLDTRHAVLAGTLASAAVFGFPVFCLVCPVGLTFATLIGLWHLFQFNEPSWALVVFPAILVLEVTVLRKWCAKICPISALISLAASANRTLRPRVDGEACLRTHGVDCHACVDACPERLDPHSGRIPECSKCGACVEACPAYAIKVKLLK